MYTEFGGSFNPPLRKKKKIAEFQHLLTSNLIFLTSFSDYHGQHIIVVVQRKVLLAVEANTIMHNCQLDRVFQSLFSGEKEGKELQESVKPSTSMEGWQLDISLY